MSVKLKPGLNHVYTKIGNTLLADFINLSVSEENGKKKVLNNVRNQEKHKFTWCAAVK